MTRGEGLAVDPDMICGPQVGGPDLHLLVPAPWIFIIAFCSASGRCTGRGAASESERKGRGSPGRDVRFPGPGAVRCMRGRGGEGPGRSQHVACEAGEVRAPDGRSGIEGAGQGSEVPRAAQHNERLPTCSLRGTSAEGEPVVRQTRRSLGLRPRTLVEKRAGRCVQASPMDRRWAACWAAHGEYEGQVWWYSRDVSMGRAG